MTASAADPTDRGDVGSSILAGWRLLRLRGLQYALGFVTGLMIARALGPAGRASYALPLNLAAVTFVAFHASIELAAARLIARREVSAVDLGRVAVTAGLVLGTLGSGVAIAVGLAFRDRLLAGASGTAVVLAALTIPPAIASQIGTALVIRRGGIGPYGRLQTAQAILQIALVLALLLDNRLTPESTLAVNLCVAVVSALATAALLHRSVGPAALRPTRDARLLKRVLRTGLSLHPSSLALFLNLRLDLLLVGVMLDVRRVGLYSLAVTLAELVLVATSTMSLAAVENQAELSAEAARRFTIAFTRRTTKYATGFVLLVGALSYPGIPLVYGEQWRGAVLPFVLLCLGTVALAIEQPARGLLLRVGRPAAVSLAATIALAVNVGANLALIPVWHLAGAAVASIASYWTAAGLMVLLVRRASTGGIALGAA